MNNNFRTIPVDLGERGYDIIIGEKLLEQSGRYLSDLLERPRTMIVTDEKVDTLHGQTLARALESAGIEFDKTILPQGEEAKSWEQLEKLIDALLEAKVERGDTILAFGGGVVGDVAGFAAAVLRRGISFVQIPTTLLAQVDSSVGGKTGINTRQGKNLVGAFHQPRLVLADISLLQTLDDRQLRAGYAEVAKCGLIGGAEFFAWLEENADRLFAGDIAVRAHAVEESCLAKARIVALDEKEAGARALLNLGHTFAHALERVAGYGELLHGEAVSIGTVMAFDLSVRLGLCPAPDATRVRGHLSKLGLPVSAMGIGGGRADIVDKIIAAINQDKKVAGGKPSLVLARGIGDAFLSRDVDVEEISTVIKNSLAA